MDLPVPFGKYELLERIATGGMAEVFLARSFGVAGFEKRLVIKRIRPEHAQDPRFVGLFIHEAKVAVHLNHPNVVQVFDLGRVGGTHFIAMEHLHGRDLNRTVKALRAIGERLPLPVGVGIVADVLRGLAYAHARTDGTGQALGLVHRDVSPHNIVVTFEGEVKLVDFGIARLVNTAEGRHDGANRGRPGGGKYAYMSPEQARGEDVDLRSDVFSSGIVLWELIVGHRLFQDPDPAEKLRKVVQAVIPHPREEGIDIDDELWRILCRALAADRDQRYPDAAAFEEDLRAWLFASGHRVGPLEIGAVARHAFPGEAERVTIDLDLRRIATDLEQLDAHSVNTERTDTPAEPLPAGRLRTHDGERKPVSVLVIEVDGATGLSAADPEAVFGVHFRFLRWLRPIVDKHGGCVQRSVDDQVLVLFGVPRTRADDAVRALECAIELVRRVGEVRTVEFPVELAIGAHVGEVTIANNRRVRYEAAGDTTRLARRLSAVADHGQILVSERMLRRAVDFRLHRGPDVPNRGGRPPDASYVLEGRRRGFRSPSAGPWMRRGRELEVLRDALVDLERGQGRLVVLAGETGSGKTRLVAEIRDVARKRGLRVAIARCQTFMDPPTPFGDLVRSVLGADPEVGRDVLGPRLDQLVELGLSPYDVEVLGSMVGLRPVKTDPDEAWAVLGRLMARMCHFGPMLFVLEDLHRLEAADLPRMRRLLDLLLDRPALMIVTHRGAPDGTQSAVGPLLASRGTVVELGAFGELQQRRLLRALLDADEIAPALLELVVRTCEGNPLYVEEMTKFLLERGRVVVEGGRAQLTDAADPLGDSPVPDTIAALLSARIDGLDAAAKGALQLAAVIGQSFTAELLADAAGVADVTPMIVELAAHGLIHRVEAGGAWAFRSELVRHAALRGILGVQRRDYHRLAADAIARVHPDDPGWAERLAVHHARAERYLEAARTIYRTGEAHERSGRLERARESYAQGLQWLQQHPERPDTYEARIQGEAMLRLRLGVVQLALGETRHAVATLEVALDVAADAGLPWIESRAHLELGHAQITAGRLAVAAAHLAQARETAPADDEELIRDVLQVSATLAHQRGRNDESEALWQEVLRLSVDDPRAHARALTGLASRDMRIGAWDRADRALSTALAAARQASDPRLEARVLNHQGLLASAAGRYDDALAAFRRALELRAEIGHRRGVVVNHHDIANVHRARGDLGRAHVSFERSRELAAEIGWEHGIAINEVWLAFLDAPVDGEAAITRLQAATVRLVELGDTEAATTGEWLIGAVLASQGKRDEAVPQLDRALAQAERYGLSALARAIEATRAPLG